jgi:hypothetical protein
MLLRVPPFHVAHEIAAEGHGSVFVPVRPIERAEGRNPVGARVQTVRVVEDMPRLVAHVAHDLAAVFEIVDRTLELAEVRIGQIERNAEHRLHVWAAPLVGEVADRAEFVEPAPLELFVQLTDVRLDRRPLELESQLADALAEDAAQFRVERFECRHLCGL